MRLALFLVSFIAASSVIAAFSVALEHPAFASEEVLLGPVVVGGAGCKGLAEAKFENSVIFIKLPEFKVELDAGAEATLVHAPCTLSLPVTVPAGKRLTITHQRIETQLDLPIGAAVNVKVETFFPGTPGAHLRPRIQATSVPLHTSRYIDGQTRVQTRCGSSENLRANLALVMDAKPFKGVAKVSASQLILTTELQDCEKD